MTAWEKILQKVLVGSNIDSSQWNSIQAGLRDRAFFSSKVAEMNILDAAQQISAEYAKGGKDLSRLRMELRDFLEHKAGYVPSEDIRGTIKDLTSKARLDVIIKTNVAQARGFIQYAEGMTPGAFAAFPAQEFTRIEHRREPRTTWPQRWKNAGGKVYGGRMIALKDDPVWTRLSVFGEPFPPFDWGSGMGVVDVSRKEAIDLGLITEEKLQQKREELREAEKNKTLPSMNGNLQAEMPMRHDSPEARKLADIFGDQVKFDGNKVHFQGELMREVFDGKIKKASLGVGYNGDKTSISRALIDDHVVKHVGENETYGGNVPIERGDMDLLPYLWRSPDRVEEGHSGNDVLELDTISGATLTMVVRKGHGPLTIYKYRREHRGANARGLPENGASATT